MRAGEGFSSESHAADVSMGAGGLVKREILPPLHSPLPGDKQALPRCYAPPAPHRRVGVQVKARTRLEGRTRPLEHK